MRQSKNILFSSKETGAQPEKCIYNNIHNSMLESVVFIKFNFH